MRLQPTSNRNLVGIKPGVHKENHRKPYRTRPIRNTSYLSIFMVNRRQLDSLASKLIFHIKTSLPSIFLIDPNVLNFLKSDSACQPTRLTMQNIICKGSNDGDTMTFHCLFCAHVWIIQSRTSSTSSLQQHPKEI